MGKVLARRLAHSKLYPVVLAFSLIAPAPAQPAELSQSEVSTYRNAINNASRGRSAQAVREVRRSQNEVAKEVVQWFALQQGSIPANFNTYADFIRDHADWPRCVEIDNRTQCDLLRRQAELRVSTASNDADIIRFFEQNAPLTPNGLNAYATALTNGGQHEQTVAAVRRFFVNGSMTRDEQNTFYDRYRGTLNEADREARVDRLLWDGATDQARALVPSLTSPGYRALTLARIALQKDEGNAATLVNDVPASHSGDPGLAYDRARRLAAKDNERAAAQILIAHGPATNGKASAWWRLRERVARELLSDGDSAMAYKVASQHGLKAEDGVPYLTAEWTAGWIALRFRGDAVTAAQHFKGMYEASTSVISKGRSAYWMGRAVAANGQEATARQWYEVAAQYGTTFYGQIAAHELYGDVNITPPTAPTPSREAKEAFNSRDMARAVRVGVEIGNHSVAKAFINALADASRTQDEATLVVQLGADLRRPDLAAWAAKRTGRLGYAVPVEGYPTIRFTVPSQPESALIHSITRQESTFYQYAKSGANAQGLMQLLPATAAQEARRLGIPHQPAWLMSKPEHNVTLGSSYLHGRIEGFDGSYILGVAAYNGGPGNAAKWRNRYGPPGSLSIPTAAKGGEPELWGRLDWVEMIPFSETREYVQFVLSGAEVYRSILNKSDRPARLQLRNNLMR